jgi:hypothetical protein
MLTALVNLYSHLLPALAGFESLDEAVNDCFFPTTNIVVITFSDTKSFNLTGLLYCDTHNK